MTNVPMRFSDTPLLWLVEDVYSADECRDFVDKIERWGCCALCLHQQSS